MHVHVEGWMFDDDMCEIYYFYVDGEVDGGELGEDVCGESVAMWVGFGSELGLCAD